MTDLIALAEAAGLAQHWKHVHGETHEVAPGTLRKILGAIGLPAGSDDDIRDSLQRVRQAGNERPLVTAVVGQPIEAQPSGKYRLTLEDGTVREGADVLPVLETAGYHTLEADGRTTTIAVAPRSCFALPKPRCWGLAAQLYSLRRPGDAGIGDFAALARFLETAGKRGADAVAISPVHAQFSADPDRFSPYAPSSRIMLNVMHGDATECDAALEQAELVEWPAAGRVRLRQLRALFEREGSSPEFAKFRAAMGEKLEAHARFEALHAHFFGSDPKLWHWRTWPEAFRNPASPAVQTFAQDYAREVAFHAFLQFHAERGLQAAQRAAKEVGMSVGLISDLAVGADGGGSHGWSRQEETLIGLSVGAPPDLLNTQGQNWGITAFSPRGLQLHGFQAFIEMLRAALRHAGGVRIDHVMGLRRLWVIPEGASAAEGAYLSFPARDLLRLAALESHRHKAIVLGEDLGTLPESFQEQLIEAGLSGMRVLWFEQYRDGRFKRPSEWSHEAVAMTTTHDLPTVAGWWSGRDIFWRKRIGLLDDHNAVWFAHENRAKERNQLWDAMRESGAAQGDAPPPGTPVPAVDAAISHVARSACDLVLLPLEDALARLEQPNLPGTLDEHPNWRRRLPGPADELLDPPEVSARLSALAEARSQR
ncbi:MAG TPA: 4-alpha-glucanotransferase [Acetobacteraceae bacterium]|nr:4-alpha-glucanotransferase [Acetobacteraceae bacterium]